MTEVVNPRILCVDDEQRVLDGLERTLFDHFEVVALTKPEQALELLQQRDERFAVMVSDMRMPGMDGATLLAHARRIAPDTTRVLLTGHSDMEAAMAAINQGHIFRFLSKPCPPEVLVPALTEAAEQHRLVVSERELLGETLTGSIRLLTEILSLIAPQVFSRTQRVRMLVMHMVTKLGHPQPWKFELAAALSLIGCVGVPEETLTRAIAGLPLDADEKKAFAEHPLIAHRLLAPIPRFQEVAEMVRRQMKVEGVDPSPDVELGAAMLRIARDVEQLVESGSTIEESVKKLAPKHNEREQNLAALLRDFQGMSPKSVNVRSVRVTQLTGEMVLEDDVRTTSGVVVVPRGRQLNMVLLERLLRFARAGSLIEPIRVQVPRHAG
ncbi:MAG: response regulator [Myxococcota bacterium]